MSEEVGDEILARVLQDHANVEASLEHWHLTGRMIGAVYAGIAREGTPDHDALELTVSWMECHIFDRIEKMSGFQYPTDDDTDETEPA